MTEAFLSQKVPGGTLPVMVVKTHAREISHQRCGFLLSRRTWALKATLPRSLGTVLPVLGEVEATYGLQAAVWLLP